MTDSVHAVRAASFSAGAAGYAAVRPSYPKAAVDWVLSGVPAGARVLDLAAGTGKLTSALVERGFEVVAVEPSSPMLAELRAALPTVETHIGTAEAIPLPDNSVAAVVCGQAWHWFSESMAALEIARVLEPDGVIGVLWNTKDDSVDWVAQYDAILHDGDTLPTARGNPQFGALFGTVEHKDFLWVDHIPSSALRPLAASRSYLLTLPAAQREALLKQVDFLVESHPDLTGRHTIELPYVTNAYRARLIAT